MKMNKREFLGHLTGAGMLALAGTSLALEGCPAQGAWDQLETWIPVAIVAFDGVVAFVDSVLTAIGAAVDVTWKIVEAAVNTYIHTPNPTGTLLEKVIAGMDALESQMQNIIAALPPGLDATILKAAQWGFAFILATLKSIEAKINPTPTPVQLAAHAKTKTVLASLPAVPAAKDTDDFIKQFNAGMAANGQTLQVK